MSSARAGAADGRRHPPDPGRDINAYLLREARALARRAGLLDHIDFGEGRAEALPLPDAAVDVALSSTVFEEGDADWMLVKSCG